MPQFDPPSPRRVRLPLVFLDRAVGPHSTDLQLIPALA